jgi:diacylglycerol kinase family enzyme
MPLGQDAGNGVQVGSMSAELVLAPSPGVTDEVTVPEGAPLFIVLNAGSGKHEGEDVRLVVEATLTSAGRQFSIDEVDDPEKLGTVAAAVVERARARKGVVVAAGGDGTINAVAAATLGSGCPFGVLPLGTFNYFSRAHGIPSDPRTACQMLLGRRAFAVQVGLVNDRIFLVNGSIGLYPDLLEEREQAKSQLGRNRWVAIGAALSTLLRPHHNLRIEVELESGRRQLVTRTLFVGNNHLQLERVGIPASDLIERHRLVAVVLEPVSIVGMLVLIVRALFGRLAEAGNVQSFSFRRMTVRPRFRRRRRFKVATDGEVEWLPAPLEFRVAPHPLLLLRPADPGPDPG